MLGRSDCGRASRLRVPAGISMGEGGQVSVYNDVTIIIVLVFSCKDVTYLITL
jgi:hypothetical protein